VNGNIKFILVNNQNLLMGISVQNELPIHRDFTKGFTLAYDAENRLVSVTGAATANFSYDADGKQVKAVVDGVTTYYVGNHYEVKSGVVTKYYFAGTTRLALRTNGTLSFLLADHLGSSSLTNGTRPHAVTSAGSNTYGYDDNGNQITRHIGSDVFDLSYDAENRLMEVKKNSVTMARFTYNGDGQKVKSVINGETLYLINGYYEKKGNEITKYYLAGASRVAMRKYTIPQSMELEYMLGDHLGSASITTDSAGAKVSEMRYTPWGEVRYHWVDSNLSTTPAYKLPVYSFTGQRSYMDDPSTSEMEGFGLMDYNARMYDPALGRFTSADSIVPGGIQGLDRYAYVNNSPVMYTDPSGHQRVGPDGPYTESSISGPVGTVLQVNYAGKFQFDDNVTGYQYSGSNEWSLYGNMACGLVMFLDAGVSLEKIGPVAEANGYTDLGGIQPSQLEATYKAIFGSANVRAFSAEDPKDAIKDMFFALQSGAFVGVDLLVSKQKGRYDPSASGNISHFARVLGIDFTTQTITLTDSLNGTGTKWEISFDEFIESWHNPEVRALAPNAEPVDYWYIILTTPPSDASSDFTDSCEHNTCSE
jgi:RHS repeat-associated protein